MSDPNPGVLRWVLHAVYDAAWLLVVLLTCPWWMYRCLSDARFRRMAHGRLAGGLRPLARARQRPRVLVHGVSVGEVKGAQALVRALEREHGELDIVISATTDTGLDVARKLYPQHAVVRFPLDMTPVVDRFLRRIDPVCVVLVELEIWPNFLRQANRRGIPIAVVNGRITQRSFAHYHWFRNLLPQFNRVSLLCVQDESYGGRFQRLSADPARILVTGNIKVDGLCIGAVEAGAELTRLLGPRAGQAVIVAGSTHEPEEQLLVAAWRSVAPTARLILVPRHPGRADDIERALASASIVPQRLTRLRAGEVPDPARPVIVDTIGELESVYGLADLVFVGGSLIDHGGQNMLEPAAQGKATCYGPHVRNFLQEAALLEARGASFKIASVAALPAALAELLADRARRAAMGRAGQAAVATQKGATELTLRALRERCGLLEHALAARTR